MYRGHDAATAQVEPFPDLHPQELRLVGRVLAPKIPPTDPGISRI